MVTKQERDVMHSIPEASSITKIPRRTLYRAIEKQYLTHTRISGKPFVTLEDIEAWKHSPYYMPSRKPRNK